MNKLEIESGIGRLRAMEQTYGKYSTDFEGRLYNAAATQLESYEGGYWRMYRLSNGGLFLSLGVNDFSAMSRANPDGRIQLTVEGNGYQGRMSFEAASLVLNIFAVNSLMWWLDGRSMYTGEIAEKLTTNYTALREFALVHDEVSEILRALD